MTGIHYIDLISSAIGLLAIAWALIAFIILPIYRIFKAAHKLQAYLDKVEDEEKATKNRAQLLTRVMNEITTRDQTLQ